MNQRVVDIQRVREHNTPLFRVTVTPFLSAENEAVMYPGMKRRKSTNRLGLPLYRMRRLSLSFHTRIKEEDAA